MRPRTLREGSAVVDGPVADLPTVAAGAGVDVHRLGDASVVQQRPDPALVGLPVLSTSRRCPPAPPEPHREWRFPLLDRRSRTLSGGCGESAKSASLKGYFDARRLAVACGAPALTRSRFGIGTSSSSAHDPYDGPGPSPGTAQHRDDGGVVNHGGRPPAVDGDMLAVALRCRDTGEPVTAIARHLGVGRSTLYRTLSAYDEATATRPEEPPTDR
ncbi:helix-turn-helix domain-containing protein [Streptomyces sp. NPDC059917]|uniref:helix-turn-helix domain-containing protein n=1 Tax=Streptomyces sp. NPDC059917 TaxID=3347002 RepID=UPI003646D8E5